MIEVTAVLDDGTVEQYHIDAKELVFVKTAEEVARREAMNTFIEDLQALLARHQVTFSGMGRYDEGPPDLQGPGWSVSLSEVAGIDEWGQYDE